MKIRKPPRITFDRPNYAGEICYFPEMKDYKLWPLYKAEFTEFHSLNWEPVKDPTTMKIAVAAAALVQGELVNPCVRNDTLRGYAVNLAIKCFDTEREITGAEESDDVILNGVLERVQRSLLIDAQHHLCVPYAVDQEIEVDRPHLATIEHMLAIAERTPDSSPERITYGALSALKDLRAGINPSGGMFAISSQLEALGKQFPVLAQALDSISPAAQPVEWFVVRARDSGKFDDGYYGWDGWLTSEAQIHRGDALPYVECPELERIPVGQGEKPALSTALERVTAWLEIHQPDPADGPSF